MPTPRIRNLLRLRLPARSLPGWGLPGWGPSARGLLSAALLATAALVLSSPTSSEARGGAQPPPGRPPAAQPPARQNPNLAMGARLFDQCIKWVARGQRGVSTTRDFHIQVIAELDLDTTRHRGPMRLWWKSPDKYRQELTTRGQTTTKILNADFMWIVHPNARVQRMHGTPEGASAVRQLKEDRDRMADLAQFITLQSLRGPGVTFEFVGEKKGRGTYAGNWLKVTRRAPGATLMHFWLAFDRDARGAYVAKWPGVVRIEGDARQRIPTEDFILKSWADAPPTQPRGFRYPRVIEAYSINPGRPPMRFLKADVKDIKINAGIPDSRFRPPLKR